MLLHLFKRTLFGTGKMFFTEVCYKPDNITNVDQVLHYQGYLMIHLSTLFYFLSPCDLCKIALYASPFPHPILS